MTLSVDLQRLASRFHVGWHDGIKIDASDIMLLNTAAARIEALEDSAAAKADNIDRLGKLAEREANARREAQEQLYLSLIHI